MKYILTIFLVNFVLVGFGNIFNGNKFSGLFILAVSSFGIYLVFFPDFSTTLANFLGVGRGTDLLFYCLFIISILCFVICFIKINNLIQLVTALARSIALSNVNTNMQTMNLNKLQKDTNQN